VFLFLCVVSGDFTFISNLAFEPGIDSLSHVMCRTHGNHTHDNFASIILIKIKKIEVRVFLFFIPTICNFRHRSAREWKRMKQRENTWNIVRGDITNIGLFAVSRFTIFPYNGVSRVPTDWHPSVLRLQCIWHRPDCASHQLNSPSLSDGGRRKHSGSRRLSSLHCSVGSRGHRRGLHLLLRRALGGLQPEVLWCLE
jgi:hypothetical protein